MAKPLRTENAGFSAVVDWNLGRRESDLDHARCASSSSMRTTTRSRRASRFGAPARSSTRSKCRRSCASPASPSAKLDYQAGVYVLDIQTDTTSRNYNGAAAGAFFATNAQYAALDTPSGRPLLDASLDDVLVTTFQNPATDSVAVFGQVELAPHRARDADARACAARTSTRRATSRSARPTAMARRWWRPATRRPTRSAPASSATCSVCGPAIRSTRARIPGSSTRASA